MGDENPIRTLRDYSKPNHEGYRNTFELLVGNNVVPLRSDTIQLVQNECSIQEHRSEDPNQHFKDFLKLVDSLNLDADDGINETGTEMPVKEAKKETEAKKGTQNKPIKRAEREETTEASSSQPLCVPRGFRDMEDKKRPFILGTPILTTAKAVIKYDKGTITPSSRKSKISFHGIPESLYKVEKGIKNDIEPIAPTMTVNRLVLKWEEKIKHHQEKEMKFDQ
nr:MAK10-like protein [Tanacetum cinerariifolium]